MKCPRCGLINDDTTVRCDCGYNFTTASLDRGFVRRRRRIQNWWPTKVLLLVGAFVVVEAIALVAVGGLLLPGGLLFLIVIGYLLTWENVKS